MMKRLIIGLAVVTVSLAVALWLLSWLPDQSHQFSVPSDIGVLAQGESGVSEGWPREAGKDLRVLFVGDTSFGESYHHKSFFQSRGYDYFLEKLAALPSRPWP